MTGFVAGLVSVTTFLPNAKTMINDRRAINARVGRILLFITLFSILQSGTKKVQISIVTPDKSALPLFINA